ncbi:MAG: hypothetical protein JJLCMIEE_01490 [Acidimicrobiales bacterium]|nr:MAG: DUF4244 domain-containing protein [Actinomycetota bacterium]MBV6508428.1 hypothetical protein [Acidimicrobiales bacterium]RIK04764.1 MAG: hypothetical protein DCC48_11975 [Acidobacteriota bacterium]
MYELVARRISVRPPRSSTGGLWRCSSWLALADTHLGPGRHWRREALTLSGAHSGRTHRRSYTATALVVHLQTWLWSLIHRDGDDGQSTAEYALVLLGAAAVALLVVSWATKTNWIARLYNAVMESIVSKVT